MLAMSKLTKRDFNEMSDILNQKLPDAYDENERIESYNHLFKSTERNISFNLLYIQPKNSEGYFEICMNSNGTIESSVVEKNKSPTDVVSQCVKLGEQWLQDHS